MTDDALRRVVLELGLEDDIPLWEVADTCRASGVITDGAVGIEVLARTLVDLARKGEIRVLVGPWSDPEPRYAELDEAAQLLLDLRRYSSAEEAAHDLERVYYVNVHNIPE